MDVSAPATPRDTHDSCAKRVRSSIWIRVILGFVCLCYTGLAVAGIHFYRRGGYSVNGNVDTLTSILAVSGIAFTLLSTFLSSQCKSAGLQSIAKAAINKHVTLASLHNMDVAVNGSLLDALGGPNLRGVLYQIALPLLAILTSVVWKKALGTGFTPIPVTISGNAATYINPTNSSSGMRGASWPAAIMYNTTASIGSNMSTSQQSWTYLAANTSDDTGLASVTYSMPSMPWLVGSGTFGYVDYFARSVPAYTAGVYCSDAQYDQGDFIQGIINVDNWIQLYKQRNSVVMQVNTSAGLIWSCVAELETASENVHFASDGFGSWNVSQADYSNVANRSGVEFEATQAQWNMMTFLLSSALATTARQTGWNWNTSTSLSPGYASMLVSARLSLAVTAMACNDTQIGLSPPIEEGQANMRVEQVLLFVGWPLFVLIVSLLIQAAASAYHFVILGRYAVDFGILQVMEMQDSATRAGVGCTVVGNCSERRTGAARSIEKVAIRSVGTEVSHLGLVSIVDKVGPQGWAILERSKTYT